MFSRTVSSFSSSVWEYPVEYRYATVPPSYTRVFSGAAYSIRATLSAVVRLSSRMSTASMVWVYAEEAMPMASTFSPKDRYGRTIRKTMPRRIARNR